jgi:CYTH domain-containing protein
MAKEIERKFLLDKPIPWELGNQRRIKQGYIFVSKNKQMRVRVIDHQAYFCLKYTKNKTRDEYEYEIPLIDGLEMMSKCNFVVEKIRNIIQPIGSQYIIDVDSYPNGLVVAEVEFKTEEDCDNFKPFDWFGEEITGNKEYSNITLAKQKLQF